MPPMGADRIGDVADDRDRLGFAEDPDWLRATLGRLVPSFLAHRFVVVSVAADRKRLRPGETTTIDIEFHNRLPVPVTVRTPRRRLWGWTVDGELAASDERPYTREVPGTLTFRGGERKTVRRRWDGRFNRVGDETYWEDATPGDHEIRAFLATRSQSPAAATTVRIVE